MQVKLTAANIALVCIACLLSEKAVSVYRLTSAAATSPSASLTLWGILLDGDSCNLGSPKRDAALFLLRPDRLTSTRLVLVLQQEAAVQRLLWFPHCLNKRVQRHCCRLWACLAVPTDDVMARELVKLLV